MPTAIGYVYFIHAPEVNRVKIGWTKRHPDWRLKDLQVASPVRLVPLGVVRGQASREISLQKAFSGERRVGEWFEGTEYLMEQIRAIMLPWPVSVGGRPQRIGVPRITRRRVRPLSVGDPEQRQLHITAAVLRIVDGLTVEEVAEHFSVGPATIKRWTRLALKYTGPASERLRAAARGSQRRKINRLVSDPVSGVAQSAAGIPR